MTYGPLGVLLETQIWDILDKVPPERLAAFRQELMLYVVVGSDSDRRMLINWATISGRVDERAVVLKLLDFLTRELALQLKSTEDHDPIYPAPATILHEKGIRHDVESCQHCEFSAVKMR